MVDIIRSALAVLVALACGSAIVACDGGGPGRARVVTRLDPVYARLDREHMLTRLVKNGWRRAPDDLPDPEPGWKGGFLQRLVTFLVRNGSPVGGNRIIATGGAPS